MKVYIAVMLDDDERNAPDVVISLSKEDLLAKLKVHTAMLDVEGIAECTDLDELSERVQEAIDDDILTSHQFVHVYEEEV